MMNDVYMLCTVLIVLIYICVHGIVVVIGSGVYNYMFLLDVSSDGLFICPLPTLVFYAIEIYTIDI